MRTLVVVLVLSFVAAAYAGYQTLRSEALGAAYRSRLRELNEDYAHLSARYAAVVERTATTELVVEAGRLSVVVATLGGEQRRIVTPFDPNKEIFVDYVVKDSRLWIRRVHDSATAADDALRIDPDLADPDWSHDAAAYGLSIYRPLSEGRWVVSVTANGALELVKKPPNAGETRLAPAPEVRSFDQLDVEVRQDVSRLSAFDIASGLWQAIAG